MSYESLLDEGEQKKVVNQAAVKKVVAGKAPAAKQRGCSFCPLNEIEGINKLITIDKIVGRPIMVWAQNPGESENITRRELSGEAGKYFWKVASMVGLTKDMCDLQHVVRCWPVDKNELDQFFTRPPDKKEIHCCSIYNEEAIAKNAGKAKVHLVLGNVAAKVLLRGEYRKDQKTFYSQRYNAWVVCTYHPNYIMRDAPASKVEEFQEALRTAVEKTGAESSGQYSYIESRDYKAVPASRLKEELLDPIYENARKGLVTSVDIEYGFDAAGKKTLVYVGFSWKPGHSRGVLVNHELLPINPEDDQWKFEVLYKILTDPSIPKCLHHGVSDLETLEELWGLKVKGFVHDTILSEYLRFSARKAYGLEVIADTRFRQFAGYKGMLLQYKDEKGRVNFYTLPRKVLVRYNGADCDLTKRIYVSNKGKVDEALLYTMMHAAPVLSKMERHGPWLDTEYFDYIEAWLPNKIKELTKKIRGIAEDPKLNPNSPDKLADLIYKKLKLGKYLDKEWLKEFPNSTNKETLQQLANFHPLPQIILDYRSLTKKKSTYVDAYKKSAALHGGRVRTRWWLTGTITGRLRSGGEKDKSLGLVNLQNIHGAPEIECLLVADRRWRELFSSWKKKQGIQKHLNMEVLMGADHAQLEIRVLAQMSKDPLLCKLIQSGEDIHSAVGHELTGRPIEVIKKDRDIRTAIKGIHFGIIYGMVANSLYYKLKNEALQRGEEFNMSPEEVDKLYKAYFRKFSRVESFMKEQVEFGREHGYVRTLFGFPREITMAGDETRSTFWENQCKNTPIQGTGHQLMLIGMALLDLKKKTYALLQKTSMEVHDSLYSFVKLFQMVEAYHSLMNLFEKDILVHVAKWWPEVDWVIPLKADAKAGFRFGVMVEYKGESPEEFVDKWCEKNQKMAIGI